MEDLLSEARKLAEGGVKELILIAEETTLYGTDLYGKKCLHELLEALCQIPELRWIRILYCYPEEICKEDAEDVAKREWAELQEYNGKSVEEIRSTFGKDITNDDGEHIDLNYKDILVTFNVSDGIVSLSDCIEVYNSEGVFCNVFYV
jgi:hypothetical protein